MSIQAYDIQLGPAGSNNSTQIIEATAQICDFLSSGSAFDQIEVRPNFMQGVATLKLGQGFDFGAPVDRWLIVNKGTTAINGTVMLSSSGFRNFRISGDVNVLDGSKSRTLNNSAFGVLITIAAVASQYARGQLLNPAGSGVRAVVETVALLGGGGAVGGFLVFSQAALANAAGSGISKLAGGAGSAAKVYWDTTLTGPPTTAETGFIVQAAGETQQKFVEPIILPPGWGLTLYSGTLNTQMQPAWEWYEEPNT